MRKKNVLRGLLKTTVLSALMVAGSSLAAFAATAPTNALQGTVWTDEDSGITYECISGPQTATPSTAASGVKQWAVKSYDGKSDNVVIPDTIAEYNYVTKIEDAAFADSSNVKKITLPSVLSGVSSDTFKGLTSLESIEGTGQRFTTKDGILYWLTDTAAGDYKLLYVPDKISGDVSLLDTASGTITGVNAPFDGKTLTSLTIPKNFTVVNEEGDNGFSYTFYGAKIGKYEGDYAKDGALFDSTGNRLISYGTDSNASLSSIAQANPYAFYSYQDIAESNLSDTVKQSVPFVTYASDYAIRHFTINGKTAYCYNMGKKIPLTVNGLKDYDTMIADESLKNKITLLLFAAAPNDGLDIAKDMFGDGAASSETLKNATGSLVWEYVEGGAYKASSDDIYGTDGYSKTDVNKYLDTLRNFVDTGKYGDRDLGSKVLGNFKLSFYPSQSADTQGLIVITDDYHPAETGSYRVDKTWELNYSLGTPEEVSTYVRLYRRLKGSDAEFTPVGDAVKLSIHGTERTVSHTWYNLDVKNEDGIEWEYKAYEVDSDDQSKIYDGSEYKVGRYTYSGTFTYKDNSATFVNTIEKKKSSGGSGGSSGPKGNYSGWDGPSNTVVVTPETPKTETPTEVVPVEKTSKTPTSTPQGTRAQPKTGDPLSAVLMISGIAAVAGGALSLKKKDD